MKSATVTCNAVILTDMNKLVYNKYMYMYTKLNKSHSRKKSINLKYQKKYCKNAPTH